MKISQLSCISTVLLHLPIVATRLLTAYVRVDMNLKHVEKMLSHAEIFQNLFITYYKKKIPPIISCLNFLS